ncbi:MAG: hypothetical protein U5K56_05065 [Halioglobus sp.]|nr:hypothetical protein [Halioglobus sp.]
MELTGISSPLLVDLGERAFILPILISSATVRRCTPVRDTAQFFQGAEQYYKPHKYPAIGLVEGPTTR